MTPRPVEIVNSSFDEVRTIPDGRQGDRSIADRSGTSRMKTAVTVAGVILSLGAFVAMQQQADSQVPPSVNTAARSRLEFPEQAFEACTDKVVGAACSVDAGEQPTQGICAKASAPGRTFCFRAPERRLRISDAR